MENTKRAVQQWEETTFSKLAVLGLLAGLLLIPVARITSLVGERMERQQGVAQEISGLWGSSQTLLGPVLTVPYKVTYEVTETSTVKSVKIDSGPAVEVRVEGPGAGDPAAVKTTRSTVRQLLHTLPAEIAWSGRIEPEIRYRGLFEVVVYEARLTAKGFFVLPGLEESETGEADWRHAAVALGIPDARGLQRPVVLH